MTIDMCVGKKARADISFPDERIVPAMCFEGANASGKTCGLRVLSFIYDFCLNSFFYPLNSPILYDTYFHNEDKSEFYITFTLSGKSDVEYTYELEVDKRRVYSEKLTEKAGRRSKILLRRKGNQIVRNDFCPVPNGIIYKDTASFISTLIQYGVEEIQPFRHHLGHRIIDLTYLFPLFWIDQSFLGDVQSAHLQRDTGIEFDPGCFGIIQNIEFRRTGPVAVADAASHDGDQLDLLFQLRMCQ